MVSGGLNDLSEVGITLKEIAGFLKGSNAL